MNYLEESARTASGHFHGELVSSANFLARLRAAIDALNELDRIKKLFFYGADASKGRNPDFDSTLTSNGHHVLIDMGLPAQQSEQILHGILGIATEAGELLEALRSTLWGKKLDLVNLTEEIGDVQWYEAMLCRAIGTTFEQVQHVNIEKLKVRFPDKFTSDDANDRDLDKERKVLESVE